MKAIAWTEAALKTLRRAGPVAARKIVAKVELYAENPLSLGNQVKALKGSPYLRLRVGDYRVVFSEDGIVVTIVKVGHRKEIYD